MNQEGRRLRNQLSSFVFPASEYLDQTGAMHQRHAPPTRTHPAIIALTPIDVMVYENWMEVLL